MDLRNAFDKHISANILPLALALFIHASVFGVSAFFVSKSTEWKNRLLQDVQSHNSVQVRVVRQEVLNLRNTSHTSTQSIEPSRPAAEPRPAAPAIVAEPAHAPAELPPQMQATQAELSSAVGTAEQVKFPALPVPKKLLSKGLFPRKYVATWNCPNANEAAKLLSMTPYENSPMAFVDKVLQKEFAAHLARHFPADGTSPPGALCEHRAQITFAE